MPVFFQQNCRIAALEDTHAAILGTALAGLEPWQGLGYTAAGLCRYLSRDDPALQRCVLLDEATPAGVYCLRQPWLRGPFLELLCLLPAWQGRGLGTLLLADLAEQARTAGQANLWTSVTRFNGNAQRFYHRLGFEEAGLLPDLIRPGVDEILLRRRL